MRNGKYSFDSGNLMTAQTLADRSEVSVENVTYYTPRGILRRIRHRKNNYRLNRESDIGPLRFIRQGKTWATSSRRSPRSSSRAGAAIHPVRWCARLSSGVSPITGKAGRDAGTSRANGNGTYGLGGVAGRSGGRTHALSSDRIKSG